MTQNIMRLEKDIKKVQKQVRRLQPKIQKAANNYNRIRKEAEKGNLIVDAMEKKRDALVQSFLELPKIGV